MRHGTAHGSYLYSSRKRCNTELVIVERVTENLEKVLEKKQAGFV
jgi:hypothetical protein